MGYFVMHRPEVAKHIQCLETLKVALEDIV